jgi:hypothetical protein
MEELVSVIVLKDNQELKKEKIDEWRHGKRPNDTDIGHYRSKAYEDFKYRLNPLAYGTADLILTGQTANSLFLHKGSQARGFIFGMKDRYNLLGEYGWDILGLNENTFFNRQQSVYVKALLQTIKTQYKIA